LRQRPNAAIIHPVWRRPEAIEITTRLDAIRTDLTGIINFVMRVDAKLDRLTEGLLEDEDDGGEGEGDVG
jgi:hypothetical protein